MLVQCTTGAHESCNRLLLLDVRHDFQENVVVKTHGGRERQRDFRGLCNLDQEHLSQLDENSHSRCSYLCRHRVLRDGNSLYSLSENCGIGRIYVKNVIASSIIQHSPQRNTIMNVVPWAQQTNEYLTS